ncbi:MAG: crossover junction endodeoxyribonuclease RuvC [Hydrogenophilus sp.]|nr:crossover junction endodeoxyribonuclease RuvC [Hydrogenophilus sp.]
MSIRLSEVPVALSPSSCSALTILGIDPGLRCTGWGVIVARGAALGLVDFGAITPPPELPLPRRLAHLFEATLQLLDRYSPTVIAVEEVFVNKNPATTLLLGQARGAVLAALTRSAVPLSEYTALQIKQGIVGYGKATKTQVQEMVRRYLSLSDPPPPDAADALACAILHAHQSLHPLSALIPPRRRRGRFIIRDGETIARPYRS